MTREQAKAEIEDAGGIPHDSAFLKFSLSEDAMHFHILTTPDELKPYWEMKTGEARDCVLSARERLEARK